MSYISDNKQKFEDLIYNIKNKDRLKLKANGGNSILFIYPPNEEYQYIDKAKETFGDNVKFIDVSELLLKFLDSLGWDEFQSYYEDFHNTPHLIFKSDDPEKDLFDLIIDEIKKASDDDKVPFLIRTGCFYGTGIDNVIIMENKVTMNLKHPLVIFYPSKIIDDKIYFLNFKHASKYRCTLVK